MTTANESYKPVATGEPVLYKPSGLDEVDTLLTLWVAWKREQKKIGAVGAATSLLGRLVKHGEGDGGGGPGLMTPYPEELMQQVGEAVEALPGKMRRVVREEYHAPAHWTSERKARKCGISRVWYWQLLKRGKRRVFEQFDWPNILIA